MRISSPVEVRRIVEVWLDLELGAHVVVVHWRAEGELELAKPGRLLPVFGDACNDLRRRRSVKGE